MATLITKTIKSAGGDYSSRSAWEAAQQGNLVTLDEIHRGEIYNFSDTTSFTVDGSTTDATRYMEIVAPTSDIHAGIYNTSKARLEVSAGFSTPLTIADDYFRLTGEQIFRNSASGDRSCIEVQSSNVRLERCILKSTGTGGTTTCIFASGGGANCWVSNTLIYDCLEGFQLSFNDDARLYNVTIKDCGTGLDTVSSRTIFGKNVLIDNCTVCCANTGGTLTLTTCASSDGTADDFGGTGNRVTQTFTFVNAAADDFHLSGSDAGALDFGTDLSADATYPITIDIDGDTRSGSWDIGADEVVSAGSTFPPVPAALLLRDPLNTLLRM